MLFTYFQVAKRRERLLNYMLFLRLTPTLPNTFINFASPIVDVPYHIFFLATAVGLIPAAYVTVKVQYFHIYMSQRFLYCCHQMQSSWALISCPNFCFSDEFQAGIALSDMRSLNDLYDPKSIAVLFLIGLVSVTPTLLGKNETQSRAPAATAASTTNWSLARHPKPASVLSCTYILKLIVWWWHHDRLRSKWNLSPASNMARVPVCLHFLEKKNFRADIAKGLSQYLMATSSESYRRNGHRNRLVFVQHCLDGKGFTNRFNQYSWYRLPDSVIHEHLLCLSYTPTCEIFSPV